MQRTQPGARTLLLALALLAPASAVAVDDLCDAFGPLEGVMASTGGDVDLVGATASDRFGWTVAAIGDVNGDGTGDLAIGAPNDTSGGAAAGAVYVFFGPADPATVTAADADLVLTGAPGTRAGMAIAGLGDVDADGFDDFAVGAPFSANGSVHFVRGGLQTGAVPLSDTTTLQGPEPASRFGWSLAGPGDVDGDGLPDILIGAPSSGDGAAYVIYGPGPTQSGAVIPDMFIQGNLGAEAGSTVAGIGDFDGDGLNDMAVAAPGNAPGGGGRVHVIFGSTNPAAAVAQGDVTIIGPRGDRFGAAVSAGDVDEDGFMDLIIGAPKTDVGTAQDAGAAYVFLGAPAPVSGQGVGDASHSWMGSFPRGQVGIAVAAGDVDNDGLADVAIGSLKVTGLEFQAGTAHLAHAPLGPPGSINDLTTRIDGATRYGRTGTALAIADLNRDGFGDLMVGSREGDAITGSKAGRVGVFLGGADLLDASTWYADVDGDGFGDPASVAEFCEPPEAAVQLGMDCDDNDAGAYPGAPELCDDVIDRNCDGLVGSTDHDGDGFTACEECDDNNADVFPGATELCDGIDQDCDGAIDNDAIDAIGWYVDADEDGFGDRATGVLACTDPGIGPALNTGGDCDDSRPGVSPAALEVCNGRDDNCDGGIDQEAFGAPIAYRDADGDGFGTPDEFTPSCGPIDGYVLSQDDCDDTDDTINPNMVELCDRVDNDCDGARYLGGEAQLSAARHVFTAATGGDQLGYALTFLDDQDGDGDDELVIAAPEDDAGGINAGAVYITPGHAHARDLVVSEPLEDGGHAWSARILAPSAGALLGSAVASGDFDGDGIADLVVGAPGFQGPNIDQGAALLFTGPVQGDLGPLQASTRLRGDTGAERAGEALAAGDLDGDGIDDLLVGAPYAERGAIRSGVVGIFYGGAMTDGFLSTAVAEFVGPTDDEAAGAAITVVGDMNGDGLTDFAVGAPGQDGTRGAVHIVFGTTGRFAGPLAPDITFIGRSGGYRAGMALTSMGDVDGDGLADLLIGSARNRAYLVLGDVALTGGTLEATADVIFRGDAGWGAGSSMLGGFDLNADGLGDFVIGAAGFSRSTGFATLYYGGSTWADLRGTGRELRLEDVEHFGRLADDNLTGVVSAANEGLPEGAHLYGLAEGDKAGAAFAAGDVDGDGFVDLALSAPSALGSGQVYAIEAGPYGLDVGSSNAVKYYVDADADGQAVDTFDYLFICEMHTPWDLAAGLPLAIAEEGISIDCNDHDATIRIGTYDPYGDGIDQDCDNRDSQDQPPVVTACEISPAYPEPMEVLTVTSNAWDAEADPIRWSYRWQVNGVELPIDSPVLPAGSAALGDFVQVDCTPFDGFLEGDPGGSINWRVTTDWDSDGLNNRADNCPGEDNAAQLDLDGDGSGDACDSDDDNDGASDSWDNCPRISNSNQANLDGDGLGDVCDPDRDGDGVPNELESCPDHFDDQADFDGDGVADACDPDDDGDGIPDTSDNCRLDFNPSQADLGGDGIGDPCDDDHDDDGIANSDDNCLLVPNSSQVDTDNDQIGNACDADDDGDGILDEVDLCPTVALPELMDLDGDGVGDLCDPDDDDDGIDDIVDTCPVDFDPDQLDTDGDLEGDACDDDDDNDGIPDVADICPTAPDPLQGDQDSDEIGDACDPDVDGDGVLDVVDLCPTDPAPELFDNDEDGLGDRCDDDDDNDGILDAFDLCPVVADPQQRDNDDDLIGDLCDDDDDNDGVLDVTDVCPKRADPDQADNDGDGRGDICDNDDDNDGLLDVFDECPFDFDPGQPDLDGDGHADICQAP